MVLEIKMKPIGVVKTGYTRERGTRYDFERDVKDVVSEIEIFPQFRRGLLGVEKVKHLIVLYWLHELGEKERVAVQVLPHHVKEGKELFGSFATRSPRRPNPIGLCVVEVLGVEGNTLRVKGLDAFDSSPVIDIKAYRPEYLPDTHQDSADKGCSASPM